MQTIERHGRIFHYMTSDEIEYIPKSSKTRSPQSYIEQIEEKHKNIKILGYRITDSSEFHGNSTEILYEYKGILLSCETNHLLKATKIGGVSYRKWGFEYVIKCVLDYYNPKIKLLSYKISDDAYRYSSIYVKCDDCNRAWTISQTSPLIHNGIKCKCEWKERSTRVNFDGTNSAYFYVHKFQYGTETVYKYGITHDPEKRFYMFGINNDIHFENIICVKFENELLAVELETTLKGINCINHMKHIDIKDGKQELTDEDGLKFIIEELTYMEKI